MFPMPLKSYAGTETTTNLGEIFLFSLVSNISYFEDNAKAQSDIRSENFNHKK
jgi:hypothetical protein